jgi:hypothetical protein
MGGRSKPNVYDNGVREEDLTLNSDSLGPGGERIV